MTQELTLIRQEIASIRGNREGHMRLYDARIANALGDVVAALLLERIVYFFCLEFQGHQPYTPFYKFRDKCQHQWYRKGDSFIEELSIRKACQFDSAIKTIGTKLKCPSKKDMRDAVMSQTVAIFDENGIMTNSRFLVSYETDARRVTRYSLNEALYCDMLQKINTKAWGVTPPLPPPRPKDKPVIILPPQKPQKVTPPAAPVVLTREQEINAVIEKYPALDEVQKKGVIEVFNGYKKEELKNWRGLLNSLCQKALQNELSLPVAPIVPAKPKVEKAKPKGKRLEANLKTELMRELQAITSQSDWLICVSATQFVQTDNGIIVLVPNDFILRHFKQHPELIQTIEAVTGLRVVGVRIGSMGDWDCE